MQAIKLAVNFVVDVLKSQLEVYPEINCSLLDVDRFLLEDFKPAAEISNSASEISNIAMGTIKIETYIC